MQVTRLFACFHTINYNFSPTDSLLNQYEVRKEFPEWIIANIGVSAGWREAFY